MDPPETRYVAVGDSDVAYQVVGEGPLDLLYCYGLGSHIELMWEVPVIAEFLTRLASFSRLIFFDRRGTGASDGVSLNAIPTWEEWTEDIEAVLDCRWIEADGDTGTRRCRADRHPLCRDAPRNGERPDPAQHVRSIPRGR